MYAAISRPRSSYLALLLILVATPLVATQDFAPPASKPVDVKVLKTIKSKVKQLANALTSLKKQGLTDPMLADVEVYYWAVVWTLEHKEFFQDKSADWALEALDRGLLRAHLAGGSDFPWLNPLTKGGQGQTIVRAHRSQIDGSVQPYAVTFPTNYGKDPLKKWRVDVVLHERDKTLTEVKFLHNHNGDRVSDVKDHVRIDIYGRGNNAYRWAGELDVLEAVQAFWAIEEHMGRGKFLDSQRRVLRGFSMGGAGTWHLGLHYPDKWCVLGPGAGFTETHGYIPKLPDRLPYWQEAGLKIYDAAPYAENVFDVPVVAYAGAKDPQQAAALNIQKQLKGLPFADRLQILLAPGLGHKFPDEWQQKAEAAYAPFLAKGRAEYPRRVHFVTYTLKYPSCDWATIMGLEVHYRKALVDAEHKTFGEGDQKEEGFQITTANVTSLHLRLPGVPAPAIKVVIDGQTLEARTWAGPGNVFHVYLRKRQGQWKAVLPQIVATERRHLAKVPGIQGPIDDAFTDSFLCVRGTGKPWHEGTQKYAEANLERFREEWSKHWRGVLPVKDDVDVNDRDLAVNHLILFGDPASNSLIAQVLDDLPLSWTKKQITLSGRTAAAKDHVPVLIYPSPLNAQRYVVLNSGHTFHAADYQGTNALLYPRLGDFALLRLFPTKADPLSTQVIVGGLFDDRWRIGTTKRGE